MGIPANLVINADDFGLDLRVSRAIALALDEGLINSFSVLPFEDAAHDALLRDVLSRHPGVRVGAHLLAGADALDPAAVNYHRSFLRGYALGRFPASRVAVEWREQIRRLGAYAGGPGRLSHLDSHQHIHLLPGLWPAVRRLREEFRIPELRVPYDSLRRAVGFKFPLGLGLQALAWLRRDASDRRLIGFFTSACFTMDANRGALEGVLARPEARFELMVHPALPSFPSHPGSPGARDPVLPGQLRELEELRRLRDFFAAPRTAGSPTPA